MPYIGNDLVDLNMPENRGKAGDRRFLERVFTPDEQDDIRRAVWPDAMLWALWAGKEAAYKALSKEDPAIPSTPRRYPVRYSHPVFPGEDSGGDDDGPWAGVVDTPGGKVSLLTHLTGGYVHSLTVTGAIPAAEHLISEVMDMGAAWDASLCLRRAVAARIASLLAIPAPEVAIRRGKTPRGHGPPRVLVGGRLTDMDISLSHDGRYGAFLIRC